MSISSRSMNTVKCQNLETFSLQTSKSSRIIVKYASVVRCQQEDEIKMTKTTAIFRFWNWFRGKDKPSNTTVETRNFILHAETVWRCRQDGPEYVFSLSILREYENEIGVVHIINIKASIHHYRSRYHLDTAEIPYLYLHLWILTASRTEIAFGVY